MVASPTRTATAVLLLLLLLGAMLPAAGAAQQVVGRVRGELGNVPVADVAVALLAGDGTRLVTAITDSVGAFRLQAPAPGSYILTTEHVAWAPYRSEPLHVRSSEVLRVEITLSRTVYGLDALNVLARGRRHEPTYEGLYARIPRFPMRAGPNRILVKGDMEFQSVMTVRDVLERFFYRLWLRRAGICLYWNGSLASPLAQDMFWDISVDELEGMEVYSNYLLAPPTMMGPPMMTLATQCAGVVGLWALRPDLPGRQ